MMLYNGPGAPSVSSQADFEILRKYMCRICSHLAVNPYACSCGKIICKQCCSVKVRWHSQGKKETLSPIPHRVYGPVFAERPFCDGVLQSLSAEDFNEWRACMVFKCVYGCSQSCIPYELLENHIQMDCPMRPQICSNLCGEFKFPDPAEDAS